MRAIVASFVLLAGTAVLAQQPGMDSTQLAMSGQCVMNHPITAKFDLKMTMTPKAAATGSTDKNAPVMQPVTVDMTGDMARDSDGRQKLVMNVALSKDQKPMQVTVITDPIEKRVVTLTSTSHTYTETPIKFVTACTQHLPTVQDYEASFKSAGVTATRLEDKQIEGYTTVGYKLDIPKELLGKEAAAVNAKPDISVWVSTEEGVPMLMQMAMQSAQFDMNMDMTFTHIHRVETPVAAFKIPEGYTAAPEKGAQTK